nr:hypothetical protein [Tanacetum cinerariifolium]
MKLGRTVTLTAEDMQKKNNDVKERTTLLLSLPDEHQLWTRCLIDFWRNRSDLNTMSLDDLYNHLKVYESEVQKKSESNSQNMAFISLAKHSSGNEDDKFWKKTGKKISIQGSDVEGLINQSAESKVFDNSLCSKDCKKNNDSLNSKITDLTDKLFDSNNLIYHYKLALAQVKSRLVKYKERKVKYCEKIRTLEFYNESNNECIEIHKKKLETLKQEKEGVDRKLASLLKSSKDLDNLIKSQRSDKNKDGLGYNVVPPLPAQLYLSPKKDLSWTGLPECKISTGSRNFPTSSRNFPTASRKFPTGSTKCSTADMGMNGKVVKPSACSFGSLLRTYLIKGSSPNKIDDKGYWDSGCSRHMTGNISYLSDYEPFDGGYVSFGQGGCKITGKGTIKTDKLEFENVYFVKDLKYNLFSVSQICDNKNSGMFTDSECIVLGRDFELLDDANILLRTPRRLGHLNFKIMNKLVRRNLVRGLPTKCFENDHTCTACLKGKQHKASLTDDFSRFTWTFFLKSKDETSGILKKFITEIENLKDLKVKIIRTPQQNGVAESRNRTLIEAARTMLADAKLPVTFWAEAVNTACYVQNRVLVNKSHNKTPYELFNARSPAIGFLKPFGWSGPTWLFDIDTLTKSMNYNPVVVENKSNASQEVKKDVSSLRYIALLNWAHDALLEFSSSKPQDHYSTEVPEGSGKPNPTASTLNPLADQIETLTLETPIPTVSSPVPTAYSTDSQEPSSDARLISKRVANQEETPSLDNILSLINRFEDILRVTSNSDESYGVEADISNMEIDIIASPTLLHSESIRTIPKDPEFPAKVYKVEKAMYGLHQTPRAWYGTLSKYFLKNGFQRDIIDQTLFIRKQREDFILVQNMLQLLAAMDKFCGFRISCLIMDLLTKPFDAGRFQYLVVERAIRDFVKGILNIYTSFVSHIVLSWVIGTSKYWGVLRILMISLRLIPLGEGLDTPTEGHHTPSPEAHSQSHTTHPSLTLPPVITTSIPTVTPSDTPIVRQYTRRTRIAQSSVPSTIADEPASPLRDVGQEKACPTDSGFIADQDRATIDKSSTLPQDSAPQVTSPVVDEGSMQQTILELTTLCTSLQRQLSELTAKFQAQEVEINRLKERVKMLEDREGVAATRSGDDAPIKGRSMDEEEATTERIKQLEREEQRRSEQIARDVEISRIHVEEELRIMINGLDRNNETVAKYLQEYHQFASELPIKRRIKLITDLVKSNLGWKVKDFRGMSFKEVEAKFNSVWKQMEDFIPMGSKEEGERIKRKGLNLEQESAKKQKTLEE